MSTEHAEEFHTHLSSDSELRSAVLDASENILEIARAKNLHFTREELAEVFRAKLQDEASDPEGADPLSSVLSERPGE